MMTPLQFEALYESEWSELEALLGRVHGRKRASAPDEEVSGARVAMLYRRACEHLALARARFYPAYVVDRLERLTSDAHQLIYHRREFGMRRLKELVTQDFPRAVRRQAWYVAAATAAFGLPTIVLGLLVYSQPELILSVVSSETAASFEEMYAPTADSIGRARTADTDWIMFGYYIRNNVGVAFQCFAGGLLAGVGTLFFLGYNGAFGGALAGYLTHRGLSSTFYSFVVTHAAFELTAIVLAGAAGLRIGHALIAPGRVSRVQSLVDASRESAVMLYGVTALLFVAAAVEAFWSSAAWLPVSAKYAVAAVCWIAVLAYLSLQGRRAY
jgi:uncharacterized membrane protein SpoIIM required for sporulation